MVGHHGAEDNTLGPDDCKAYGLGPVANTDTKLLIYGLFQKGRILAQDGSGPLTGPCGSGKEATQEARIEAGATVA